jgi:hypothetical protein
VYDSSQKKNIQKPRLFAKRQKPHHPHKNHHSPTPTPSNPPTMQPTTLSPIRKIKKKKPSYVTRIIHEVKRKIDSAMQISMSFLFKKLFFANAYQRPAVEMPVVYSPDEAVIRLGIKYDVESTIKFSMWNEMIRHIPDIIAVPDCSFTEYELVMEIQKKWHNDIFRNRKQNTFDSLDPTEQETVTTLYNYFKASNGTLFTRTYNEMFDKYIEARKLLVREVYPYPHCKIENMFNFYVATLQMHKYHVLDSFASPAYYDTGVRHFYFTTQEFYHHFKTLFSLEDPVLSACMRTQ